MNGKNLDLPCTMDSERRGADDLPFGVVVDKLSSGASEDMTFCP
jgi:hypothetical protein